MAREQRCLGGGVATGRHGEDAIVADLGEAYVKPAHLLILCCSISQQADALKDVLT